MRTRLHWSGKITLILSLALAAHCWAASPVFSQPAAPAPEAKPIIPAPAPEPKALTGEIPEWQARLELARLLSYTGKYGESAAEYEKVLAARPGDPAASAELARVLFWDGKRDKAMALLAALPKDRLDAASGALLADLLAADGKYAQAEALYREQLAKAPQDLKLRLKLAELLSWKKDYPASLAQYEEILAARPNDLQVRRKYALVLSWAGRNDDAIAELKKTLTD